MTLAIRAYRDEPGAAFLAAFTAAAPPARQWAPLAHGVVASGGELWLARDGERTVGRIGASLLPSHPGAGAVGFFELDADAPWAADRLLAAAESWLAAAGCTRAVGPLCLNTWFPYRFRIDEHDEQFRWEPGNPSTYPAAFEARGYRVCASYSSTASEGMEAYAEAMRSAWRRATSLGYQFEPIDRSTLFDRDLRAFYDLSISAFSDAYLFEPISFEAFSALYVPLADKDDLVGSFFARDATGAPVGYLFSFADGPYAVWKTIAVHPAHRGTRAISGALMHVTSLACLERGFDRSVAALIRDGVQTETFTRRMQLLWTHRYALYERMLPPGEGGP